MLTNIDEWCYPYAGYPNSSSIRSLSIIDVTQSMFFVKIHFCTTSCVINCKLPFSIMVSLGDNSLVIIVCQAMTNNYIIMYVSSVL